MPAQAIRPTVPVIRNTFSPSEVVPPRRARGGTWLALTSCGRSTMGSSLGVWAAKRPTCASGDQAAPGPRGPLHRLRGPIRSAATSRSNSAGSIPILGSPAPPDGTFAPCGRQPIGAARSRGCAGSSRMIARSASSPSATISTAAHSASACSVGTSMGGTPAWVETPQVRRPGRARASGAGRSPGA